MSLKELIKTLKSDKILIPKIDQYLISHSLDNKGDGWIHPSGLTSCVRKIVLNCLKYPRVSKSTAREQRIYANGDFMHRRFQKWLKKMDALIPCPICLGISLIDGAKCSQCNNTGVEHSFIWKDRHMRGRCDGILRPSIFNGLLELKSMNTDRFDGMQGPDHGYIWQAHCYMKAFGFDQTLILYENKNNQSLKEFIIRFDDETWNHIDKKIDEINRYVSAHKIPDGECGLTDIDEDCEYSMICRRFYEGK